MKYPYLQSTFCKMKLYFADNKEPSFIILTEEEENHWMSEVEFENQRDTGIGWAHQWYWRGRPVERWVSE